MKGLLEALIQVLCLLTAQLSRPFYFFLFFKKFYLTLQYCIGFAYIKMNLPQVYVCSPSWTLLPPPFPYHPSGSSQCTSPKHPVSSIKPGLAIHFIFWMLSFKPAFSLSSFTVIKMLFSSLLSAISVVSSAYLRLLIFLLAILIPACA